MNPSATSGRYYPAYYSPLRRMDEYQIDYEWDSYGRKRLTAGLNTTYNQTI